MSEIFEIHGHRGARARYPDNTLSAFQYALGLNIDAIEIDVALSKDLVPVIHHDRGIAKNANAHAGQLIKNLSLQEIREINVGTSTQHESIPLLSEFIELVNSQASDTQFRMNIEIKTHPILTEETHDPDLFVKMILETLSIYKVRSDRILFQSFDPRMILALNEAGVNSEKSFLFDTWTDDILDVADHLTCEALSPEFSLLNSERAQLIRENGLNLYTWTVNDPKAWEELASWGVSGIITDDPESLLKWRQNIP